MHCLISQSTVRRRTSSIHYPIRLLDKYLIKSIQINWNLLVDLLFLPTIPDNMYDHLDIIPMQCPDWHAFRLWANVFCAWWYASGCGNTSAFSSIWMLHKFAYPRMPSYITIVKHSIAAHRYTGIIWPKTSI